VNWKGRDFSALSAAERKTVRNYLEGELDALPERRELTNWQQSRRRQLREALDELAIADSEALQRRASAARNLGACGGAA
jgi:hypothetical protein